MISKELLSAVLETEVKTFKIENELIIYNDHYVINIYKLAHLCKEWAFDNGFRLQTQKYKTEEYQCIIDEMNIQFHSAKYEVTEHEAIFKACEWIILKGKK